MKATVKEIKSSSVQGSRYKIAIVHVEDDDVLGNHDLYISIDSDLDPQEQIEQEIHHRRHLAFEERRISDRLNLMVGQTFIINTED